MVVKKKEEGRYTSVIDFNKGFEKILKFYLFECPIENVSKRGKLFKDFGWKGSSRFQMLERLLKSASGMTDAQWHILDSSTEVRKESDGIAFNEQFLFSDKSKGRVRTFIYSIRNSLAHGSFKTLDISGKKYYYFENEYRKNLRSKMFLSEDTLLEWIKIIRTRPEYLRKKVRKKRK